MYILHTHTYTYTYNDPCWYILSKGEMGGKDDILEEEEALEGSYLRALFFVTGIFWRRALTTCTYLATIFALSLIVAETGTLTVTIIRGKKGEGIRNFVDVIRIFRWNPSPVQLTVHSDANRVFILVPRVKTNVWENGRVDR